MPSIIPRIPNLADQNPIFQYQLTLALSTHKLPDALSTHVNQAHTIG